MKRPFKFNGELNPLESFQPKEQLDEMKKRAAEGARQLMAIISVRRPNHAHAHSFLDDLMRKCQGGHGRYADIHLRDIGLDNALAHELEEAEIYTINDLANSCVTKLPAAVNIMDALRASLTALRRVLDLELEQTA